MNFFVLSNITKAFFVIEIFTAVYDTIKSSLPLLLQPANERPWCFLSLPLADQSGR